MTETYEGGEVYYTYRWWVHGVVRYSTPTALGTYYRTFVGPRAVERGVAWVDKLADEMEIAE